MSLELNAGRQYDKDGNLRQWWNNDTINAFRQRAQCIIDQYSNYVLEPLGMHVSRSACLYAAIEIMQLRCASAHRRDDVIFIYLYGGSRRESKMFIIPSTARKWIFLLESVSWKGMASD